MSIDLIRVIVLVAFTGGFPLGVAIASVRQSNRRCSDLVAVIRKR